jgi:hypothetical protein
MNESIFNTIESLFTINDILLEKVHNLYHSKELKNEFIDITPINCDMRFSHYKRKTYKEILSYQDIPLDQEKIIELLEIRYVMIEQRINILSENNIGTTLNICRELWNDILIDIKRNVIS